MANNFRNPSQYIRDLKLLNYLPLFTMWMM